MKKGFFLILILLFCSYIIEAKTDSVLTINKADYLYTEYIGNQLSIFKIKKNITPVFIQNNDTEIGLIDDKDGYTNIREQQNSSSKIISIIKENEYFFYNKSTNSNWFLVKDLHGNVGFVYKNRIKKMNSDKLYSLSINKIISTNESYSINSITEEKTKDTIVRLEDLDSFFDFEYQDTSFNYDEIKLVHKDKSSVVFKKEDISVHISKTSFDVSNHKIGYNEKYNNIVESIDGKEFYGADGNLPNMKYSAFEIVQNNILFKIPKEKTEDLYEPNFGLTSVYSTKDGRIIIVMHNSDGAGAYSVLFIIKNGVLLKKHVFILF
ncbi:hypothetical protein [uncultured Lacinutrix sp.]|uniref:hypothetical protein n=1 Tax=uncultured Lacinutrix sp. TaxID=574032 RepID=UPI002620A7FA|nr:hypothetical protein [uncultured Lacinutrix sp.]